jgi:hypothetical protein
MQPGVIYEEKIFSKWMTAIMAPITALMVFIFFYFVLESPVGTDPELTWLKWYFLMMYLFFFGSHHQFQQVNH